MNRVHQYTFIFLFLSLFIPIFIVDNKLNDINQDIDNLVTKYDLITLTGSLSSTYCNSNNEFIVNQLNFCNQYFDKLGSQIFSTQTKSFDIYFWKKNSPKKYVYSLMNGDIQAKSEAEIMFLGQYNSWLLSLSDYYKKNNLLSPLNYNLVSILSSIYLESSKVYMVICFIITILSLCLLTKFYPLSITLIACLTTFLLSISLSTVIFTPAPYYLTTNLALALSTLFLLIGATWDKRVSCLSIKLLREPFYHLPLAIIPILMSISLIFKSQFDATNLQSYPFVTVIILSSFMGFLLWWKMRKANLFRHTSSLESTQWILNTEFDQYHVLKNHLDSIFEKHIQGTMTYDHQELLLNVLSHYFKILELKNMDSVFVQDIAKFAPHFEIKVMHKLFTHLNSVWVYNIRIKYEKNLNDVLIQLLDSYLIQFPQLSSNANQSNFKPVHASRTRRLFAFMIDLILLKIAGSIIMNVMPSFLSSNMYVSHILGMILIQVYPLLCWDASLGKKILKIKITSMNENDRPIWWVLLLREFLGKTLSSFLFGAGHFLILFPGRLTLHDRLFRTKVIAENTFEKVR